MFFLIGHVNREVALKGLDKLSLVSLGKNDYRQILSNLVFGLTYIMRPTLTLGGVLDKKNTVIKQHLNSLVGLLIHTANTNLTNVN